MSKQKVNVQETFDRASGQYEERCGFFFNYFGRGLVDSIPDLKGKKVLEVATGRGAVLFPLMEKGAAEVDSIDLSPEMIRMTEAEAKKRGYEGIRFQVMDAEHLEFADETFDVVICGFAVFFCESLERVLNEFRRVLKPGGVVALSTWGNDSPLDEWLNNLRSQMKKEHLIGSAIWNENQIKEAFAKFKDVQLIRVSKIFHYESPEMWWESLYTLGTRYFLDQLNDHELSDVKNKAIDFASQFVTPQGVEELFDVFYVVGRK